MKRKNRLLSLIMAAVMIIGIIPFASLTSFAEEERDRYLFVYFTGNDDNQQQIRFALSQDGLNYKALNGNDPIFYAQKHDEHPTSEGFVRDPYVNIGEDGNYYMICTDLDAYAPNHGGFFGDTCMYVYKSSNLVDWEELTNLDVTQEGAFEGVSGTATTQMYSDPVAKTDLMNYDFRYTIRAWAPQWLWDEDEGKYLVYWSNFFNDWHCGVFYSYTEDFIHFSAPVLMYQARNNTNDNTWQAAIDEDIIYNPSEDKYYMYYKDEQTATIAYVTSDNLTGPYSFDPVKIYNGDAGLEGANAFMRGNTLTTFADAYGEGHFVVLESTDYKNFTLKSNSSYDIDKLSPRHGCVVKITRTEYDRLAQAYDMATDDDVRYNFNSHSYYAAGNLVTMGENDDYATPNDETYHAVKDTSGYWYDVRTPWWSYAYSYRKAHYISFSKKNNDVGGGNIFINDDAVRSIMADDEWTVSFNVSVAASDDAVVFALTSGASASATKDWIRLLDNGKLYLYYGDAYHQVGETTIETGVDYSFALTYNGSDICLYKNGGLACKYRIGELGFDNSAAVRYVAMGWTDTIGAKAFIGSISNLRFRRQTLSASQVASEYNIADSLIYRYNNGTNAYGGRADVTSCGNDGVTANYAGVDGSSFTVAGWMNVGATKDNERVLFELGEGGTGDGKQYFTLREDGVFNYCWFNGSAEHYFDSNSIYTFSPNTWYYVQFNIIPEGNSVRFVVWVNGSKAYDSSNYNKSVNMDAFDFNPIRMLDSYTLPLKLGTGTAYWGSGSCYIDDFRVYNRAVDASELFAAQKYDNPILSYRFENSSDAPTLYGNASLSTDSDSNSKVLKLDGSSNTYAEIPQGLLDGRDNMTVIFDVKAGANSGNYFTYAIGTDNTKYDFFRIRGSEVRNAITVNSYGEEKEVKTAVDFADSWMNVALVFDDTVCKLYINGELASQNDNTGIKISDLGSNLLSYFGKSMYSGDGYFNGSFDNFEVYDCVLSDSSIREKAMNNLPLLISASFGTIVSDVAGISGTDSHTAVRMVIDRDNNEINTFIQRRQNVTAVPVSFYVLDSGAKVYVDGLEFGTSGLLNLTYDRQVTVTNGDKTETYTLKAATIANNPVLPGMYADPDIDVLDGKFWIFPTTDGTLWWGGSLFHAFSSKDMVHWTDEGVILDVENDNPSLNDKGIQIASSSWSDGNAWAPAIEEKNGKYYFYYCGNIKSSLTSLYGEGKAIGVAYADSPAGPYTAADAPILYPKMLSDANIGFSGQVIDPSVYTEGNNSYILFGNGMAAIADLNSDMMSVNTSSLQLISNLTDFRESVAVFKRNSTYYFTWSCDDTGSENYHIRYGTSSSLKGSVTNHGVLLQKDVNSGILATGHQSVLYLPDSDRCFIAYHRFYTPLSVGGNEGYRRETCIDEITFASGGTLNQVTPTMTGVGPVDVRGNSITEIVTYPTCTEDGSITANGITLSADETPEIKASGHSFKNYVIAPTCTEDGYDKYTCTVCLETLKNNYVDKLGHSYVIARAGGDTEFNLTCDRCDLDKTFDFEDYINLTPNDNGYDEDVDIVSDGTINAKDFAYLIKNLEQ